MKNKKIEVKTICPHCKKLYDTADDARDCATKCVFIDDRPNISLVLLNENKEIIRRISDLEDDYSKYFKLLKNKNEN